MIACLWLGFWIGNRHGQRKVPGVIVQLQAAARKIALRHKFVGDGDFVPTYTAVMTVDGEDYKIAMMRDGSDRDFCVAHTLARTTDGDK